MFDGFFNFKMNPFAETPDTRFFFQAPRQCDVLARLVHAIEKGHGFVMLTGEVGVGKTLLSRTLLKLVSPTAESALLLFPALDGRELIESIVEEFGLPVESGSSLKALIVQLTDFLLENAENGKTTVLVIDEAQNMPLSALETIRQLSNIEKESTKLLQIVLVGQPELQEKLQSREARQINQRISTRVELGNLSREEVGRYIKHRIEIAGGSNFVHLEESAVDGVYQLSGGVPRLINLQCQLVLEYASSQQVRLIQQQHLLEALNQANVLTQSNFLPWRREVRLVNV